jgi:hypothetical protein
MAYTPGFAGAVSGVANMGITTPDQSPYSNGMQSLSARTSRSNSLIRPPFHENRRSLSDLELGGAGRSTFDLSGHEFKVPTSMAGAMNQGGYSATHQSNQVPDSDLFPRYATN